MVITKEKAIDIEKTIKKSLRKKLHDYSPETKNMPFHYRLIGKDRMALYSFIQSLNTTFGVSIFQPVALALAKQNFQVAKSQYKVGSEISEGSQHEIQNIINDLTIGEKKPCKKKEIERLRGVCQEGLMRKLKTPRVDLFLQDSSGAYHLFDLKTVKPNISNFKDFKKTLLEWVAIFLRKKPDADVHSSLAIPYNPYEPKPYERWTIAGMIDSKDELRVAMEFWNFLGNEGAYDDLLKCFENVGIEMKREMDEYFKKFKKKK